MGAGHVLAQFAQSRSAATVTSRRRINHHALTRKVLGEGISFRTLACEPRHCRGLGNGDFCGQFSFGGTGLQLLELQRHLINQLG